MVRAGGLCIPSGDFNRCVLTALAVAILENRCTYQPGRTDDRNARMAKLKSETEFLESQKYAAQAQLQLLKQQVAEQEIRLKRMQPSGQTTPK